MPPMFCCVLLLIDAVRFQSGACSEQLRWANRGGPVRKAFLLVGVAPDPINASINVTVPLGCAIPAGTYRVLWMTELTNLPAIANLPLGASIFIKGESKT